MKFAVIDLETTGAQPDDAIIQVGLVIIDKNKIAGTYTKKVNPGRTIPEFIQRLTGITNEDVQDAPTIAEVLTELLPLLQDAVLVAHNASFDVGYLQRMLQKCGMPPFSGRVLDTIPLARMLYPGMPSLNLHSLAKSLGIAHEKSHQADSDALATAHVLLACLEKLRRLPLLTLQRLDGIFAGAPPALADLAWLIGEMRAQCEASLPLFLDNGRAFRQIQLHVDDWTDEDFSRDESLVDAWANTGFNDFLAEIKARLKRKFDRFEERSAQDEMIRLVHDSLEQGNHLLVEAGTGTGKSLAYLLPALYYSAMSGNKTVVGTHTIHLQEQIRTRDVPLLQEVFPFPIRVALLKGRNHYLCLRKFEAKINTLDFAYDYDDRITAGQLLVWLGETETGDDEELHFGPHGAEFWRTVESDAESCSAKTCPWFKKCFYHRAKNRANQADLIVTNHSLLLSDMKAENRLLPAYRQLIIDEAHHFEEEATRHLGMEVHYFSLLNALQRFYKDNRSGLLPVLAAKLAQSGDEGITEWTAALERLFPEFVRLKEEWDTLTQLMFDMLAKMNAADQSEQGQHILRLRPEQMPSPWPAALEAEDNMYIGISSVLNDLKRIVDKVEPRQAELEIEGILGDISAAAAELSRQRDTLRFIMRMAEEQFVYWLEASSAYKQKSLLLTAAPMDVSPVLRERFFAEKDAVVLTSATLSVNQSFDYLIEALGLNEAQKDGRLVTSVLKSPFAYREQALLLIPRDFASVRGNASASFIAELAQSLSSVAKATGGRMMVLFTSYRMLRQVYDLMVPELLSSGMQVLGQGIGGISRSKMIAYFQENPSSVLLGTSSFWEGVDIPGEALSCLAIVRLPFQPPNHPLVEAKCEIARRKEQNPFMRVSVPQAVIKFKQGFGRLIRTASDKGIVIVYDTRVIETAYGKYFLYSLPGPKIEHLPTRSLVSRIAEWLAEREKGDST
ncbi:MAG TPA: ATP-dependent DNA helicase DinG [Bacilli bacterium]